MQSKSTKPNIDTPPTVTGNQATLTQIAQATNKLHTEGWSALTEEERYLLIDAGVIQQETDGPDGPY